MAPCCCVPPSFWGLIWSLTAAPRPAQNKCALADWLHRTVAGLAPAAPGYRRIRIHPIPGGGLTWARARHRTPYGPAECFWRIEHGSVTVEVEIPPNTSAEVHLPGQPGDPLEVGSGRHRWSVPY